MDKPRYVYDIDVLPPLRYVLLYGLQWAIVIFPSLIIVATLGVRASSCRRARKSVSSELSLARIGALLDHPDPLGASISNHGRTLDGPPPDLPGPGSLRVRIIQGGPSPEVVLLIGLVVSGKLHRLLVYATPNVVGVILMLIAFPFFRT